MADPSHRAQLVLRVPGGERKLRVVKPDGTPTAAGLELQRQVDINPALSSGANVGRFNMVLADHLSDTHVLQPSGRFRLARRPSEGGGEVPHTAFGRQRFEKARAEWIIHVPVIWAAYDKGDWRYFRSEWHIHKNITDLTDLNLPVDAGVVRDMGNAATQKAFLHSGSKAP